jgi:large subunit ribosomal protein L23
MKTAYDIIVRPIVTEQSMDGVPSKQYTFEVSQKATKPEIAKAVETVFEGTKVKSVRVINVKRKPKNYGRYSGYTRTWKKAIVSLTEDSKTIAFFDGMN